MVGSAGFSPMANPGLQLLFPYPVSLSTHCSAFQNSKYQGQEQCKQGVHLSGILLSPKPQSSNSLLSCEFSDAFQNWLISTRFSSLPLPEAQGQGHFLNYCFCISKRTSQVSPKREHQKIMWQNRAFSRNSFLNAIYHLKIKRFRKLTNLLIDWTDGQFLPQLIVLDQAKGNQYSRHCHLHILSRLTILHRSDFQLPASTSLAPGPICPCAVQAQKYLGICTFLAAAFNNRLVKILQLPYMLALDANSDTCILRWLSEFPSMSKL